MHLIPHTLNAIAFDNILYKDQNNDQTNLLFVHTYQIMKHH